MWVLILMAPEFGWIDVTGIETQEYCETVALNTARDAFESEGIEFSWACVEE